MSLTLISHSFDYGPLGPYFRQLQDQYGVVLEYFQFGAIVDSKGREHLHTEVATRGMQERHDQNEAYFLRLQKDILENPKRYEWWTEGREQKLGPDDRFSISYDVSKATSIEISSHEFHEAYRYAFTDPPYTMRCTKEKANELCEESLRQIFGNIDALSIRSWSTNWSNYFDAGNEWWGAFLWTLISEEGTAWWVGASTTG